MPRVCTICAHPDRNLIDHALANGAPNRRIAAQHAVSETSVRRHAATHLPAAIVKAADVAEVVRADDLLGQVRYLHAEALGSLDRAKGDGSERGVQGAIGAAIKTLTLQGALLGELGDQRDRDASRRLLDLIQTTLLLALDRFPEARAAAAQALLQIEAGNPDG